MRNQAKMDALQKQVTDIKSFITTAVKIPSTILKMCTCAVVPNDVGVDTCPAFPAIPEGLHAIFFLPLLQKHAELVVKGPELTSTGTVEANKSICTELWVHTADNALARSGS